MRLLLVLLSVVVVAAAQERGIPVPGQGLSPLSVFELMSHSCRPKGTQDYSARDVIANSLNMLRGETGERISRRMYESLVGGVGDIKMDALMGRWLRVFHSASLGSGCVRSSWSPLGASGYSGTFTTTSYHSLPGDPRPQYAMSQGFGLMLGPGPAQTLITPHDEPCPYVIVKRGPLNSAGEYSYLILSQFLKTPLIGLARDPVRFQRDHRAEVEAFLQSNGFRNPFAPHNSAILFTDFAACPYDPQAPFG